MDHRMECEVLSIEYNYLLFLFDYFTFIIDTFNKV